MTTQSAEKPKLYSFDDHPEHLAQLQPHADWWMKNATSTKPMDEEERGIITEAMPHLYRAAGFEPAKRWTFSLGPISGGIGAAIAAGVWWARKNPQHHVDAFGASVSEEDLQRALRAAAIKAMGPRGIAANPVGYEEILRVALTVTESPVPSPAGEWSASADVQERLLAFEMACIDNWWRLRNGGNQWSAWPAYLSFFQNVAGLNLPDYDKFIHYERAAIHGGPRYMTEDFWVCCDRPLVCHHDATFRQSCSDGPQMEWKDGFRTWFIDGVRVNRQIVMSPETITVKQIEEERNAEVRRVMMRRYGWDRFLRDSGATLIHEDEFGKLWRKEVPDDEPLVMVEVINSTPEPLETPMQNGYLLLPDTTNNGGAGYTSLGDDGALVVLRSPHGEDASGVPLRVFKRYTLRVDPAVTTAREAVASTWRWPGGERVFTRAEDYAPALET